MTAAIGHPTLRLIRVRIGNFHLGSLVPGHWRPLGPDEKTAVLQPTRARLGLLSC
jgi:23S rRNA pseudouridine2457 synthase